MSVSTESFIQKIEQKLGSEDFIQPTALVKAGIFGSQTALRSALRKGLLPFIQVTSHRLLIPRDAVIEHLRKGFTAAR